MERDEQVGAKAGEEAAWQYRTRGGAGATVLARNKFPVLTAMAVSLRIIGWLMVVGAGVLFVVQVIPWIDCIAGRGQPQQLGMMGGASCGAALFILAPTIVSLVSGFCMVAFGEIIGVFRGIEGNTHQLISSVEQAWNQIKLAGGGGQR